LSGNYGVPENNIVNGLSQFYESEKIQVSVLIISEYSKVPGIYGVDTRALTKSIREKADSWKPPERGTDKEKRPSLSVIVPHRKTSFQCHRRPNNRIAIFINYDT
jgi:hypothetical protein